MNAKAIWPGWEIVEPIGSGGFGKVYKIRKTDDSTGDYFSALKVITIPGNSEDYNSYKEEGYDDGTITQIFSNQVQRIVEEFRLMAKFRGNSNIVSYEDHMIVPHEDEKGWDILIRMELLTSLTKHVADNPMSEKEIIKMGIGICRALELCKKANVIHRDIKPQNIFISEFGEYKLGDFGIARTMDHSTRATKTGTYTYMAPEVYSGEAYGATIDIYSLGLVIYWALNEKRMPFLPLPPQPPTASEIEASQTKRLSGEALPAPKNGSELLKQAVLKACAPNAADRYQDPEDFRAALEKALSFIPAILPETDEAVAAFPGAVSIPDDEDLEKTMALRPQPVPTPVAKPTPAPAAQPTPTPVAQPKQVDIPDDLDVTQALRPNGAAVTPPQPSVPPTPVEKPKPPKKKKGKLTLIIVIVLALITAAVAAVFIINGSEKKSSKSDDSASASDSSSAGSSSAESSSDATSAPNGSGSHSCTWKWDYNDDWHRQICETCGATQKNEPHSYTWSNADSGVETGVCKCGHTITRTVEEEHQCTVDGSGYDSEVHYDFCEGCYSRLNEEPHSLSDWEVLYDSTTTKTGLEERKCHCGYSETRDIPVKESGDPILSPSDNPYNVALGAPYDAKGYAIENDEWPADYTADLTDGIATAEMTFDNHWFAFCTSEGDNGLNAPDGIGTVTLDLGSLSYISRIDINAVFGDNVDGSGVNGPEAITLYVGDSEGNFTYVNTYIPQLTDGIGWEFLPCETQGRYVKLEFKLRGIFCFINEIEVYN